jgi:hypothetical protein
LRTAKISFCNAIPRSPIFLVAQRVSYLAAFDGMPSKFVRWILHGPSPGQAFFRELFDFYTKGRKVNLVKIAQPLNWDSAVFPFPVGTECERNRVNERAPVLLMRDCCGADRRAARRRSD